MQYSAAPRSGRRMRPLAEKTAALFRPPSVKGRDWQEHAHLYLLRLTALLCAVLVPAFGVFYRVADPQAVDPLAVRMGRHRARAD